MERKAVWFSAFRWVVPADYERWLEDQALQGWQADKIGQWSSLRMTFTRTESRRFRYVFDFNAYPNRDYLNSYEQFGWEPVGQMASCFIWRKEYSGQRPEAFTDGQSMQARNRRVRNAVLVCLILFAVGTLGSLVGAGINLAMADSEDALSFSLEALLFACFSLYLWWVVRQIQRNMGR